MEITRAVSDAQMYSSLQGASVYLGSYPEGFSSTVTYATLSRNADSYKLDLMTYEPQILHIPIKNLMCLDQAGKITNNAPPMLASFVANMPGMIVTAANLPANAPATQDLFTVKLSFSCTFFGRD